MKKILLVGGLVLALSAPASAATATDGSWWMTTVDDNRTDTTTPTTTATASGTLRCKYGLKNIRNRYFAGVHFGPSLLYFGGQRTDWCWRNGRVVSRHTEFPRGWTSAVNSGSVDGYIWSSACTADYSSCLVRAEFLARMTATVPVVGITIGVNETFCVGTRVCAYACNSTGANHSRNITGGRCPGS